MKLELLRTVFAPKLRNRYPHTKIVVFDDWHSCPQVPRTTDEEEARFYNAMDHMNSIYCYCDVVLFLHAPLPELDISTQTCTLVPSNYKWTFFVDVVQFQGLRCLSEKNIQIDGLEEDRNRNSNAVEEESLEIRRNDIVVSIDGSSDVTTSALNNLNIPSKITFLCRPFGRQNRIPPEERGWLFCERITIAIKTAASPLSHFDDVVLTNDYQLRDMIFKWSDELRTAAYNENTRPGSIAHVLEEYKQLLMTKRFTWPYVLYLYLFSLSVPHNNKQQQTNNRGNDKLVIDILETLIERFKKNWQEESKRQVSMGKRARELLLRWGEFSERYMKTAGFLEESNNSKSYHGICSTLRRLFMISFVAPAIAIIPFLFNITDDPSDSVLMTSVWIGCVVSFIPFSFNFPFRCEFAGLPYVISLSLSLSLYSLSIFTTFTYPHLPTQIWISQRAIRFVSNCDMGRFYIPLSNAFWCFNFTNGSLGYCNLCDCGCEQDLDRSKDYSLNPSQKRKTSQVWTKKFYELSSITQIRYESTNRCASYPVTLHDYYLFRIYVSNSCGNFL